MQYTVVQSKDPYLLARLATDLQMEGIKADNYNWDKQHPFTYQFEWAELIRDEINFHNHECFGEPIRHELTSRNYISVLTKILEPCLTTS